MRSKSAPSARTLTVSIAGFDPPVPVESETALISRAKSPSITAPGSATSLPQPGNAKIGCLSAPLSPAHQSLSMPGNEVFL